MSFKKVLASAAAVFALLAPCSALAAAWSDIDLSIAESAAGTPVAFGDIRVTYNDGTYSFDGSNEDAANGTLSDVCIETNSGNSATYVFDNLKLTGSFSAKTEEEDTFCELQLGSGIEDATSAGISLSALSDSRLNAYLYTDVSAVQALAQGSGWLQGSSYGKVSSFDLTSQNGTFRWTTDVDAADISISSTPDRVRFSGGAMLGSADKPLEIRIMDAGVFYSQAEMREKIAFDVSEMINLSRVACRDENGLPRINATVSYTDQYGRDKTDSFPVVFPAQSSTVVSSVSSPVSVPALVNSACAGRSLQVISHSTPLLVPGSSRVTYDISLPREGDLGTSTLYLPYPEGVNETNHQFYDINISHKPENDFDLTNDGPAIDSYEFTEYGIKVSNVSSLGCFSVGASEIKPQGVSWEFLMRKLHEALSETQDAKVKVSESVIDELYPIDNNSTITVYAEYDRSSDTMTVSGGRLDGVRIANVHEGELCFGDFGLDSGTYIFEDVLLLGDLYIFNDDGMDYHVVLEKTVGGIYDVARPSTSRAAMQGGFPVIVDYLFSGSVVLENNTTLLAYDGHSLHVGMDHGAKFTLAGNGKVMVGNGWYEHPMIEGYDTKDYKAMVLSVGAITDDNEEAIRMVTKTVKEDVILPPSQFTQWKNGECVRTYFDRMHPDRESFEIDWRFAPVYHGSKGLEFVSDTPVLLLEDGEQAEDEMLYVQETALSGSSRHYELQYFSSSNVYGEFDSASLYIPYPNGMDEESAKSHVFTVHHFIGTQVEVFSTADGSMELTPYGLKLNISSLSPYVLSWEYDADAIALPSTGDPSRMALWTALLSLSCALLASLRRRTAFIKN